MRSILLQLSEIIAAVGLLLSITGGIGYTVHRLCQRFETRVRRRRDDLLDCKARTRIRVQRWFHARAEQRARRRLWRDVIPNRRWS